jgi:glycosyltransferase domain-containing protein
MSNQNRLTLILTIKDRGLYTRRWVTYANKISFPFKVLIADGGKDQSLTEFLSETRRFPNIDYEYIRYPYDATYSQYYAKTADALSRTSTPFAIIGQDDDFYLAEGLQWAVDFLSTHSEYVACNGRIDDFLVSPDTNVPYGTEVEFIKNPPDSSLENAKSSDRVWTHFNNYSHTYYSVYRTEILRKNYDTLCEYNFTNLILHEILLSFLTVAKGVVKRENRLYLLRQINYASSSSQGEAKRKGDYLNRMLIDSWSTEFHQFVNAVAEIIVGQDKVDSEESRQLIKKGYRQYLIPILLQQLDGFKSKPSLLKNMKNQIRKLSSENPIRKILVLLFQSFQDLSSNVTRPRRIYPSSPDFQKIQSIYDFLTSPPESDSDTIRK